MITNIDEILKAVPLDRIVGEHVQLQRRGANLQGCCPFHDEKTPSFSVSPAKGIYKCFGCGKGGNNAAQFLMDLHGYTFPEALEALAAKGHVRIEYADGINREEAIKQSKERQTQREKQIEVMKQGVEILAANSVIPEGDTVELAGKVYTRASINKWKIMLAGNKSPVSNSTIDKETALAIGLIGKNEQGRLYDFFYDRVLFPIHSLSGHIEAITGRILTDKKPKYLNSPDSVLYSKSESLFGIFYNNKHINDKGFAYLLEGPTDVILLDQYGISNAVAPCGTALTATQAKMLSRFTDYVTIIRDGDKAGLKATVRDIEILTTAQLSTLVVFLPANEDPASFISKNGADAWKEYVDDPANSKDGIKWLISNEVGDGKNEHKKTIAIDIAARLLAAMDSETLRQQYITALVKIIGCKEKNLTEALNQELDKRLTKQPKLTTQQAADKDKFGIYIQKQNYLNHSGTELSNFILKPVYLVRAGAEKSLRVFEMINENHQSICVVLNSDDMIQLNTFRKRTEMHGNFLFYGNEADYMKLRRLLYEEMPKVHQLNYLGYIATSGIYAWGNGITTPDGEFLPVNEYGRVDFNNISYYLPAFSKLQSQEVLAENDESDYEKKFIFKKSDLTVKKWTDEFTYLFGANAHLGIAFYFSVIFKDYFQKRYNFFPILNLFGPPGSGKSTMALILHSMFGEPLNAVHCITSTWSSFFRRVAQAQNAIAHYEEYSEKVEKERQEGLKGFYDGFGRPLAKKETSNKTESIPVRSAVMLSGQVLPTHDPALLTRCITLFFEEVQAGAEKKIRLDKFVKLAKSGDMSGITATIHAQREKIITEFENIFETTKDLLLKRIPKDQEPSTRVIMNYSMVFSMYLATMMTLDLPMLELDAMCDIVADRIREQSRVNDGASELQDFWTMLEYLVDKKVIGLDTYMVEETDHASVIDLKDKSKTTRKVFDKTKVLSVKLNHLHREYSREAKSQGIQRTLDMSTLKYYLSISKAFIGECKAKRLNPNNEHYSNTPTSRVWMFDLSQIPSIDLQVTGSDNENYQSTMTFGG